jgi:hypothetical protein
VDEGGKKGINQPESSQHNAQRIHSQCSVEILKNDRLAEAWGKNSDSEVVGAIHRRARPSKGQSDDHAGQELGICGQKTIAVPHE